VPVPETVPTPTDVGPEPVLRADARRNLDRILAAAREVFAEQGIDAPMTEVARRAGVGHGTLYRRFPTREQLMLTMLEQRLEELVDAAEAAEAEEDAWRALVGVIERLGEMHTADRSVVESIECRAVHATPRLMALKVSLLDALGRLLGRAQQAGQARPDLEPSDLPHLIAAATRTIASGPESSDLWRRYLAVIVDGMRAPGVSPLPVGAPAGGVGAPCPD
jgi:AcrR family transcriptional regulator